jgi:hypothetical protein
MLGSIYLTHFTQSDELSTATERDIMVVTYLENRVLQSALGMPGAGAASTDFETAFNELLTGSSPVDLSDWSEAVNVIDGNTLLLAYGMPSGLYTTDSCDCDYGVNETVTLSGAIDTTKISTSYSTSTEGWVTFPSFGGVFAVEGISGSDLILKPKRGGFLSTNSEMYYVRFLRAYVENGKFYSEDVTRQSPQAVVEGIIGCQFEWDDEDRLLTVAVLGRGNKRNTSMVTPQTMSGWDGVISDGDRYYRLSVVRRGWRVRN